MNALRLALGNADVAKTYLFARRDAGRVVPPAQPRSVRAPRYREQSREARLTHHLHQSLRHHETNRKLFTGVFVLALIVLAIASSNAAGPLGQDLVWFAGAVAVCALLLVVVHWTKAKSTRRKL